MKMILPLQRQRQDGIHQSFAQFTMSCLLILLLVVIIAKSQLLLNIYLSFHIHIHIQKHQEMGSKLHQFVLFLLIVIPMLHISPFPLDKA